MRKEQVFQKIDPLFLQGICHRGLHDKNVSENSLEAFQRAIDHHMAFELDVHLTTDGELAVFHDSDLQRMTGKNGIVEHLSMKELQQNYRLLHGEKIPTLGEVFALTKEQVPIVVELKVYEKNYKALAARLQLELQKIKDKRKIILISFDPRSLLPFRKSGFMRQVLIDRHYQIIAFARHFAEGLDLDALCLNKTFFRHYAKHHFVNTWTIETEDVLDQVLPYADTVTFQHMDPEIVRQKLTTRY